MTQAKDCWGPRLPATARSAARDRRVTAALLHRATRGESGLRLSALGLGDTATRAACARRLHECSTWNSPSISTGTAGRTSHGPTASESSKASLAIRHYGTPKTFSAASIYPRSPTRRPRAKHSGERRSRIGTEKPGDSLRLAYRPVRPRRIRQPEGLGSVRTRDRIEERGRHPRAAVPLSRSILRVHAHGPCA
jgi:hypothetical protein